MEDKYGHYARTSRPHLDLRLNVVSIANFIAMLTILTTILGAWFRLQSQVDYGTADRSNIREESAKIFAEYKLQLEALRSKDELIIDTFRSQQDKTNERLYGIESKVQILGNSAARVEEALKNLKGLN